MAERPDPPVYEALMKVKPAELTLGGWATRAGLARNAFNDIRRHGNPKHETLMKLLDVAGVSFAQFDAGMAPRETVLTEVRAAVGEHPLDYRGDRAVPPLPHYGGAVGGGCDGLDEHIELVELDLGEVLEWVHRPQELEADLQAYRLTIVGDSMEPRFRPGDKIDVSPRSNVAIGDDVIVQLKGINGDERVRMVLIKQLVKRTPAGVVLRQFNPALDFEVEAKRIAIDSRNRPAIHKVTGARF